MNTFKIKSTLEGSYEPIDWISTSENESLFENQNEWSVLVIVRPNDTCTFVTNVKITFF